MSVKGVGKNTNSIKLHHNPHKIFLHQDWREALYPDGSHTRTADWLSVGKLQWCWLADWKVTTMLIGWWWKILKMKCYGWLYSFGQRTRTGLWILFGSLSLNKSHLTCKEVIQWTCTVVLRQPEELTWKHWWFLGLLLTWLLTIRMEVLLPTSLSYWSVGALLNL